MYNFTALHVPGSLHFGPDATSRYPVREVSSYMVEALAWCEAGSESLENEGLIMAMRATMDNEEEGQTVTWEQVKAESVLDRVSRELVTVIREGFPVRRNQLEEIIKPFFGMKEELYEVDGVPFLHGRMLVPMSLRRQVLDVLHKAHQGVVGMKALARQRFWWPGMDAAVDQRRAQCHHCNEMAPSNHREPLHQAPEPEYPWQMAVADYFSMEGNNYLAVADRFTGWIELFKMDGKAMTLIKTLRNLFAQMGVPEEMASDGGPSFTCYETKQFFRQWGIRHRLSSAHYPQSNGRAEVAVKTAKRLLCDNMERGGCVDTEGVAMALLQYRNTPLLGVGHSPAQIMFGRTLKDALPNLPANLRYRAETTNFSKKYGVPASEYWKYILEGRELGASRKLAKSKERYDEHASPLAALSVGDCVSIQNREGNKPLRWDRTGQVVERMENRQYMVKCDGSGRVLLRTRGHLRKIQPSVRDRRWYDVDPQGQQGEPDDEVPLHIPGARAGSQVLHPVHGHDEVQPGGAGQQVDPLVRVPVADPGELVRGQVELDPPEVEVPVIPELRRSSRVRQEKKDNAYLYY